MDHKVDLEVPLNGNQAQIIARTLSPDQEVKPHEFSKTLKAEGSVLHAHFEAVSVRSLRVGVNSFMDNLLECLETLDTFTSTN